MTLDDIRIRLATERDSAAIQGMLARLAADTGDAGRFDCSVDDIRAHGFGDGALFESLIAERGGEHLGLALFFPLFSTTRGKPGVYLQDLWVSPDCRDAGLGSRLLRRVAAHAAAAWRAGYLDLMVHGHNRAADRFYRRHGFVERTDDRHLSIEGDAFDALGDPGAG